MYSESPSKDCFPFSDQSLFDIMPGMDEINNETNMDYFFDPFYLSRMRCNTGFELQEDCKNMSFSELFDQELFSSQENKDCKVPIKIEKEEEPLQPCYSTDITQDTTNHPLTQIEENVPLPLLAKRFAPKRDINQTSIKTINSCDVQHHIYDPFCGTEDLSIDQPLVNIKLPIIKCEPEDAGDYVKQNMVGLQVKLCHSDDSQNTANSLGSDTVVDNGSSTLFKCSTLKHQGIKKNFIKTNRKFTPKLQHHVNKTSENYNVDHLVHCKTAQNLGIDQTPALVNMRIVKQEPKDFNDTVEQNIVGARPCYSEDSQNTANGLGFGKFVDNGSPSLFRCSTPKRLGIKRTFIKTNKKTDIQHLMDNPFSETESLIIKRPLRKIQVPIVKLEPEDVNDAVEQNLANVQLNQCHIDDLQNTTGRSLIKIDRRSSSLSKNSTPKPQQYRVKKMSKNCNVDRFIHCKTAESLGINQTPALVNMRIVKQEPEDFNDTIEQNIFSARPCYSEDSENTAIGLGFDKVVDNGSSSSLQSSTPKRLDIKRTFIKMNRKSDIQHLMDNALSEKKRLIIKRPLMKIQIPIVKLEPEDVNYDAVEQTIADMQLKQCHSDDLQNTTGRSLVKIDRRSLSSVSKNSISKPQQHRVNKTLKNCNVDRFVHCKTAESLGINQTSTLVNMRIVKQEPEDFDDTVEQNIVGIRPCYSEDSQNTANGLGFDKVVDNDSSSSLQNSTSKRLDIKRTFIKMNKKTDIQHLMDNPLSETESLIIKRPLRKIQVPIVKLEPEDAVKQTIADVQLKQCHIDDLQNTTGRSSVKIDLHSSSSLSKNSTPKPQQHHAYKTSKNCNVNSYIHCKTTQSLGIDQTSALGNMRIVKQEPEDFDNTVEQNIAGIRLSYSDYSQNTTDHSSKIGENFSSLTNNSAVKHQHINDNTKSKRCNVDIETLKIVEMPVEKVNTIGINDAVEQNIVRVKKEPCFDNSQNIANSRDFINNTDLDLKNKIINGIFLKRINNNHVNQFIYGPYCKTQKIGIDQMSTKVESPIVKCEPQSGTNTIEQNIEMDKVTEDKSENEFGCIDLNNTNVDNKDIVIIKGQDILSNGISLKNDNVNSQTFTISNHINLENEKKKISWEEFRAKKGKLGYFKKFGNKGKSGASEIIMDDDKMEVMMKEFDQNTAIYLSQKKKIEDKEEQNTNGKKVGNVENEELEKNRMKIEYIKKLLPSSFASEIAKTSSLMKGNLVEDIENEITSDDFVMSSDKIKAKYTDSAYLKKDDKLQKKDHLSRIQSSRRSLRSDYNNWNKNSRSSSISSSNPDNNYNRNRVHNAIQQDVQQYGKTPRNNTVPRFQDQKKVVYVGQIPIRFGKRYLYNRFKEFGQIQSLTLHKKPDFRVYYAFVTYSEYSEALRAITHGNHDQSQVQFDIRFGERKQVQTPYYDLDDEWLTDWYGYNNQPLAIVKKPQSHKRDASFEEELQEFYKLAQIKKSKKFKSSQVS